MAKKPPKLFRKEYTRDKFDRTILKKIYIKEYKDYVQKAAHTTAAGTIKVEPGIDKKQRKKLRKIAKSVKKNTGFVLKGRLILLALIFGAVFVFGALFKDMLIEHGAEAGLEAVFGAKADIQGLHFQVFAGRLSFEHLEVADKQKPMRNLFELGQTAFDIDLWEILKGNVILEKIMCRDIKWDTPRQSSGALYAAPPAASSSASAEQTEPEKTGPDLLNFTITAEDAAKLIEEQKQNLGSTRLLDELTRDYSALDEKWRNQVTQSSGKLEELSASVEKIKSIKVKDIKTLADAQKAYNTLKPAVNDLDTVKKSVTGISTGLKKDLARVSTDTERLADAANADIEHLGSMVGLSSAKQGGVVDLVTRGILRRYVGTLYSYIYQARTYMDMLRPTSEQKLPGEKPRRLTGIDILYPTFVKPKFWLKDMSFSVVDDKSFGTIQGELQNATGQPDLIGKPMTWSLRQTAGGRSVELDGSLDLRKNRTPVLELTLTMENFPYKLEKGLEFLSVSGLDCRYTITAGFSLDNRNYSSGSLRIKLTDLKLDYSKDNLITRGLKKALAGPGYVSIGAEYTIDEKGNLKLEITDNNLDTLIGAVIGSAMGELRDEVRARIRTELDKQLKDARAKYNEQYKKLSALKKELDGNMSKINEYKKTVDAKKKELEKKIRDFKNNLLDNIKDAL